MATELVVSTKTTTVITVLLSAATNILFVYVREEEWAIVHRVVYGKGSKIECAIVLCTRPLEIEVCERNVVSGSRVRSTLTHPRSQASVLIDLMTKSAKKLVVQLPATVELGFCSASIHDVSFDSLFTALELAR